MKYKKQIRAILTLVLVFAAMIAILLILRGMADSDNMVMGNNINAGVYTQSKQNLLYDSLEEGLKEQVSKYDSLTLLYQATTKNVAKSYFWDENQVEGYEFLVLEDGRFQYIGERTLIFAGVLKEEKSDWETTVRSDLSYSLAKSYLKIVCPGEKYQVLPAWGVSTNELIYGVKLDGIPVDEVVPFSYEDADYYLWIIDDMSYEHGANSVELTY